VLEKAAGDGVPGDGCGTMEYCSGEYPGKGVGGVGSWGGGWVCRWGGLGVEREFEVRREGGGVRG